MLVDAFWCVAFLLEAMVKILVTGGAGFIGSNFVRYVRSWHPEDAIVVLDVLTYAGLLANLNGVLNSGDVAHLIRGDVCDRAVLDRAFRLGVDVVVHMAAESHVDRSIQAADVFIRTNVLGTQMLLDASRTAKVKKFLYVSTDEVLGDLGPNDPPFTETSPIRPNSPYAASKASGELLTLAAHRTHGLDVVVVRPTNNYGPRQHIEKMIPNAIVHVLDGKKIPVYGNGSNVRDWLHVSDCCAAIDLVLRKGVPGEVYCVGAGQEMANQAVAQRVIDIVGSGSISFVTDRKGHDRRYAVDAGKIRALGWAPKVPSFVDGLQETVKWYKNNETWWRR